MKKVFLIILIFFLVPVCAFADSDDWNSIYKNDSDINKPVPAVTDKEFQEAYDYKMGNKKKKKNPYENIQAHDMSSVKTMDGSYPTIVVTQRFYADDGKIVDEGHYKVVVVQPDKEHDQYCIHFFQGHVHKGKLLMNETNNDYNEKGINYAKIITDNGVTKFIYGTIDCNLDCTLWLAR